MKAVVYTVLQTVEYTHCTTFSLSNLLPAIITSLPQKASMARIPVLKVPSHPHPVLRSIPSLYPAISFLVFQVSFLVTHCFCMSLQSSFQSRSFLHDQNIKFSPPPNNSTCTPHIAHFHCPLTIKHCSCLTYHPCFHVLGLLAKPQQYSCTPSLPQPSIHSSEYSF